MAYAIQQASSSSIATGAVTLENNRFKNVIEKIDLDNQTASILIQTLQGRIRVLELELTSERKENAESSQRYENQLYQERLGQEGMREQLDRSLGEVSTLKDECEKRLEQIRVLQSQVDSDAEYRQILEGQINALRLQTSALTEQIAQGRRQIDLLSAHLDTERARVNQLGAKVDQFSTIIQQQSAIIAEMSRPSVGSQCVGFLSKFYKGSIFETMAVGWNFTISGLTYGAIDFNKK